MTEKPILTKAQLKNPCKGCGENDQGPICCNYIVFETPYYSANPDQVCFDSLIWYLTRPDVMIEMQFDRHDQPTAKKKYWTVYLKQKCMFLAQTGACEIYEKRPLICSDYSPFPIKEGYLSKQEENSCCERYQKTQPRSATFTDMGILALNLKQWFQYDYTSLRKNYPYDLKKIKVLRS